MRRPLHLSLVKLRGARVADGLLLPDVTQLLDAEALVIGIVAGEVAVGLEPLLGVPAVEEKLLVVAHDGGRRCS